MKINYRYFLLVMFAFLTIGDFCFARELEVAIPGLSDTTLIGYRDAIFNFLIGLGGALAVLSLVIGAIKWMTSAGNPTREGDAKKRIIGSVLGLILLSSSVLVMKTINPKLLTEENPAALPENLEVVLVDGEKETNCPPSIADTSGLENFETLKIKYKCPAGLAGIMPKLWVRKFTSKNLIPWTQHSVVELECGESTPIGDAASFRWDKEKPGLYLTSTGGSDRSLQILQSQKEMDSHYKKDTKSFTIINDEKTKTYYGVIFHEGLDQTGRCSKVIFEKIPLVTGTLDFLPSSFTFFQINPDPKTSGDGIDFYSHPNGWQVAASAGKYSLPAPGAPFEIAHLYPFLAKFDYTGINRSEREKELCKTIAKIPGAACGGSINIKGDYLVILRSSGGNYCQVFDKYSSQGENPATNLRTSWLLRAGDFPKGLIQIIPIK